MGLFCDFPHRKVNVTQEVLGFDYSSVLLGVGVICISVSVVPSPRTDIGESTGLWEPP